MTPLRVALVGCGAEKRAAPAPAADLYTGQLFRDALAHARRLAGEHVFVLSAMHGLVPLTQVLRPYDLSLRDLTKAERLGWGADVCAELLFRYLDTPLELHAFAGRVYLDALRPQIEAHWTLVDPLEGLAIGERLAWLKHTRTDLHPAAP